jgi:hypothetical protein
MPPQRLATGGGAKQIAAETDKMPKSTIPKEVFFSRERERMIMGIV